MTKISPVTADSDSLISWLASRDAPCPVCTYNLRGLQTDRCPECAAALHLQVGSDNLRLGPWLLAVTAPTLGLGFDGVAFTILTTMAVLHPPKAPAQTFVVLKLGSTLLLLALACTAGLFYLIRKRRAWIRHPLRRQWTRGATIFIVVGILHAIVGAIMTSY